MAQWEFERDGRIFKVEVAQQHEWFWERVQRGTWEAETYALYKQHITPETTYIDIGAWIGPTVLYGGHLAKKVFAVEPDAVAMSALLQNIALNEDILEKTEVFNFALDADDRAIDLYAYKFGDSMTSLLPNRGARKVTFLAMAIAKFLHRVLNRDRHVFIKVDIEGRIRPSPQNMRGVASDWSQGRSLCLVAR